MESFWDKLLSGSEAILEPLHVPLFTAGGSQIDTFDILRVEREKETGEQHVSLTM